MYDDTKPTEGDLYTSPEEEKLYDEIRDELFDKVNENLYIRKDEKEIEDPNEALYQLINTSNSSYEEYLEKVECIDNINYQNKLFDCGFLHLAVDNKRKDMVKDLLERGINLDLQDKKGNTAMIYALSSKQWELFKEMLTFGPDLNIKNNLGNNLLWKTISVIGPIPLENRSILYGTVEEMLRLGADSLFANICGVTPLKMVTDGGDKKLKEIFKNYIND